MSMDHKPQPSQRTGVPPNLASPPLDPYASLWRHVRRTKKLTTPQGESFCFDVEIIVAGVAAWQRSAECARSGWHEVNCDGVIIAERTIG